MAKCIPQQKLRATCLTSALQDMPCATPYLSLFLNVPVLIGKCVYSRGHHKVVCHLMVVLKPLCRVARGPYFSSMAAPVSRAGSSSSAAWRSCCVRTCAPGFARFQSSHAPSIRTTCFPHAVPRVTKQECYPKNGLAVVPLHGAAAASAHAPPALPGSRAATPRQSGPPAFHTASQGFTKQECQPVGRLAVLPLQTLLR